MLLTRQICTNENSFNKKKNPCHEKTIRNGGSGSTALRNELLTMLTLLDNIYTAYTAYTTSEREGYYAYKGNIAFWALEQIGD